MSGEGGTDGALNIFRLIAGFEKCKFSLRNFTQFSNCEAVVGRDNSIWFSRIDYQSKINNSMKGKIDNNHWTWTHHSLSLCFRRREPLHVVFVCSMDSMWRWVETFFFPFALMVSAHQSFRFSEQPTTPWQLQHTNISSHLENRSDRGIKTLGKWQLVVEAETFINKHQYVSEDARRLIIITFFVRPTISVSGWRRKTFSRVDSFCSPSIACRIKMSDSVKNSDALAFRLSGPHRQDKTKPV